MNTTPNQIFTASTRLLVITIIFSLFAVPLFAFAKTTPRATGTINEASLTSSDPRPTFTGTASSTSSVYIQIKKEGTSKTVYTSKVIKVKNGVWKSRISKKLPDGTYDITLSGPKKGKKYELATETLVIGKSTSSTTTKNKSNQSSAVSGAGTFVVKSIPLLVGGTARPGQSVPVSYLQITNTSKEAAVLKGFWVKQNGPVDTTKAVIGLTTVDDQGGSRGSVGGVEGSTPFKNGAALAPTDATFAPGQMRLFTIKAVMSNTIAPYLGTALTISVTGLETNAKATGAFPIAGTTWVVSY